MGVGVKHKWLQPGAGLSGNSIHADPSFGERANN
jgi:hypothetical protein